MREARDKQDQEAWLTWATEEYKAVKVEASSCVQVQQQILAFGVSILVAVGTVSVSLASVKNLVLALAIVAPIIGFAVCAAYVSEIERMVRAGAFIADIEVSINRKYDQKNPPLRWEAYLRKTRRQHSSDRALVRYRGTYAALIILSLEPGLQHATRSGTWHWERSVLPLALFVYIIYMTVFYIKHERVAKELLASVDSEKEG